MRLGEDIVGLRKLSAGAATDEFGEKTTVQVDVEVPHCLVVPTGRTSSDTREPDNRTAPAITGYTVFAEPTAGVELADVVVWPITSRATVDGVLQLSGREWQVLGEPGLWEDCTEVQLRAAT